MTEFRLEASLFTEEEKTNLADALSFLAESDAPLLVEILTVDAEEMKE